MSLIKTESRQCFIVTSPIALPQLITYILSCAAILSAVLAPCEHEMPTDTDSSMVFIGSETQS